MKEIDLKNYAKRNQYEWFHTFPDPTYGFDVDIDVTEVVKITKARKESFFPAFLYLLTLGVNQIKEMRLREVDGHVYLYDVIHPTFTVMNDEGIYQNAGVKMTSDYCSFYKAVREKIDQIKHLKASAELDRDPLCHAADVIFATCIPILSIKGMRHPTPAYNYDSMSVPRILWDKYHQDKDETYHLTLNITVSHTLVDGFPLANCFNAIKTLCLNANQYII